MNNFLSFICLLTSLMVFPKGSDIYYGVNGFGCLILYKDNIFTYDINNCKTDTGTYIIKGDTLLLTTPYKPVFIEDGKDSFSSSTFLFENLILYDDFGGMALKERKKVKYDTILNKFIINNCNFTFGQNIEINLEGYIIRFKWDKKYAQNCLIDIVDVFKVHNYMNEFPLLIKDGFLLPFDDSENDYYYFLNGRIFNPMLLSEQQKKYRKYYCPAKE